MIKLIGINLLISFVFVTLPAHAGYECRNAVDQCIHDACQENITNILGKGDLVNYLTTDCLKKVCTSTDSRTVVEIWGNEYVNNSARYSQKEVYKEAHLCKNYYAPQQRNNNKHSKKDAVQSTDFTNTDVEFYFYAFSPEQFEIGVDFSYYFDGEFVNSGCSNAWYFNPDDKDVINEVMKSIIPEKYKNLNGPEFWIRRQGQNVNYGNLGGGATAAYLMSEYFGINFKPFGSGHYIIEADDTKLFGVLGVNYGGFGVMDEIVTMQDSAEAEELYDKIVSKLKRTACANGHPYFYLVAVVSDTSGEYPIYKRKVVKRTQLY